MSTRVDSYPVTVVGLGADDPRRVERAESCRALLRRLTNEQSVVEAQGSVLGLDLERTTWKRVLVSIAPSLRAVWLAPPGPLGAVDSVSATGRRVAAQLWPAEPVVLIHDNVRPLVVLALGGGDSLTLR